MQLALQHTTPLPGATSTTDVPASITDRVCDVCKLSISNQHAAILKHGITPEFKRGISEKQKKKKNGTFSLNVDEATNKYMDKVLFCIYLPTLKLPVRVTF